MKIENMRQFDDAINAVLPLIEEESKKIGEHQSIYVYLFVQLKKMLHDSDEHDFSTKNKNEHSIGHALNALYDGVDSLPLLGDCLYEIEGFFQRQDTSKITDEEAEHFIKSRRFSNA